MEQIESYFTAESMEKIKFLVTQYGIEVGLEVLSALVIFVVGRMVTKSISKVCLKIFEKSKVEATLSKFLANLVYYALMAVVILSCLGQLGIQTTSFIAILGSAGLAIGLALQGSLANFAAGVLLILFHPIQAGEFIEGAGTSGTVEEIQLFVTVLKTVDNKTVYVPNAKLMNDTIVNYARKETRRIDMVLGVSYDDDLRKVKALINELIEKEERVLKDPAPLVGVTELADNSVNFVVRIWVKSGDFLQTRLDFLEAFKIACDEQDVTIPYPQRDVHIHQVEPKAS